MSDSWAAARWHQTIGGLAIVHAVIIAGMGIKLGLYGRLPVAFATLWLVWPVALLLHPGRSWRRVLIPVFVSALLIWRFAWPIYVITAPAAVGLPLGLRLYPGDLYDYFTARRVGRAKAEKDLRMGVVAVETYGYPRPPEYEQILRDRYHSQLRRIAGDTDVFADILGHAQGYNELMKAEITRRFGQGVLEAAADEAQKNGNERGSNRSVSKVSRTP